MLVFGALDTKEVDTSPMNMQSIRLKMNQLNDTLMGYMRMVLKEGYFI